MHVYILPVAILLLLADKVSSQQWYQVGNPHFLDTNTVFQAIQQPDTIKIVKFFSPWCKYCRYVKAYMDDYKNTHQINSNLKFYEFNCQSNGAMFCWQHFQVRAYPSVVIFDQKKDRISRIDGLYPQQTINSILDEMNNKAGALLKNKGEEKKQQGKTETNEQQKTQEVQIGLVQSKNDEEKKQQINEVHTEQPKIQGVTEDRKTAESQAGLNQGKQAKAEQKNRKQAQSPAAKQHQNNNKNSLNSQSKPDNIQIQQKVPRQQKSSKEAEGKIKVDKSMVEQKNYQQANKADPSKPQKQVQILEVKEETSDPYMKYFIFLVSLAAVGVYGFKIFQQKKEDKASQKQGVKQSLGSPSQTQAHKVSSQDFQVQILVDHVQDENL